MDAQPSGLRFDADAHEYWRGGRRVPNVTSVLESVGLSDFSAVDREILALAKARGTAVHRACELDDKDDLDEAALDDELRGYLAAWRKFSSENSHEWDGIERRGYHQTYQYAGTADRTGKMSGNPAALDIKSGAPQAATGPQLAAYANLFWPIREAERRVRRYGCYLRADGTYQLIEYDDRTDFAVFLSALTIFNWKGNHGL
jgi:hypothetical protein